MSVAQKGTIRTDVENIFPIIKKFLYSDHEIFLRELVSNAVDASQKLKTLSLKGEATGDIGELNITVTVDKELKTLTISDNGIGMTKEEVDKYINQIAFSSAKEFLEKYKDEASIIGHFGLGFYSAFMVADKVEVDTKSYKKTTKAVKWTCTGNPEYELDAGERKERGTDIKLFVAEDSTEFLSKSRIQELLNKYSKFLPVPIRFGTKTRTEYEGEGDDRKAVEVVEDNIVNNTDPLWKKKPNKLKEEDYKGFYRELYPMSQDPLFWIHLNIDFPFNLTGVLYFPKLNNSLEIQRNKIQLYSNQVYVTDDVKEIVPEFLMLLHGVIDSPDIPLNVSRSYLQSDSNVRKITSYITKKVADKLKQLYKKDKEGFESKWDDVGTFVKYGMISDEKFYEKSNAFALMKNTDNEFTLFDDYIKKVEVNQKDKNDRTVLIYSTNEKEQYSYIESAKSYGYDVLLMNNVIDNHFMQHMEQKKANITFVRVDSDTVDKLVQKDEEQASVLSEKEEEKVKALFTEALGELKGGTIDMRPLSTDDHPVVITKPEFMRRMKEMQAMQGMNFGEMPEAHNVIINTNHSLVSEKMLNMKGKEKKERFAKYLYNLARLNQNMLKGEELNQFIKTSIEFLK